MFAGLDYNVNRWHSFCLTWDSVSGVAQLWLDGKHTTRKYVSSGSHISGTIVIILGQVQCCTFRYFNSYVHSSRPNGAVELSHLQEQDSLGGAFDAKQSFVGMLSDVHMWNQTIPRQEITNYMENRYFNSGNVLNWSDLEFRVTGRVLVEES